MPWGLPGSADLLSAEVSGLQNLPGFLKACSLQLLQVGIIGIKG